MKKIKLMKIKRVRKLRDELFNCDNFGRAKTLLLEFPGLSKFYTGYATPFEVMKVTGIVMIDGSEYQFTGFSDMINGIKAAGEFLYKEWLNDKK